ncbi:MAG: XTP/dITP diphosphatase [Candidatus Bathyarchaeia archaeon]
MVEPMPRIESSDNKWSPVYFATTNSGKFAEVAALASEYGIVLRRLDLKPPEIQSERLEDVASNSALQLLRDGNPLPLLVEDAGLFIYALNGFPGPFSSYVYAKLGVEGILRLLEDMDDRRAYFESVVAYAYGEGQPLLFEGKVEGVIVHQSRGRYGFGFDPIFQPLDKHQTFAEMTMEEKNSCSHRAKAFRKFAGWYTTK